MIDEMEVFQGHFQMQGRGKKSGMFTRTIVMNPAALLPRSQQQMSAADIVRQIGAAGQMIFA